VASLGAHALYGVHDVDGRLTAWLSAYDAEAVLVRPDFYVFGSATSARELPALLDDLRSQMHIHAVSTAATAGAMT
jgi:hypothetical protein